MGTTQQRALPDTAARNEWACGCGQAYLVTMSHGAQRFWPRSGAAAYSRHGLTGECPCIRCGKKLT